MKKHTIAERLIQIMDERNLKQIDILNLVLPYAKHYGMKIHRSNISQYVSGKVEPNQEKLTLLSKALGVPEVWLMGYELSENMESYSVLTLNIINSVEKLNHEGQQRVADYAEDLVLSGACTNIINGGA